MHERPGSIRRRILSVGFTIVLGFATGSSLNEVKLVEFYIKGNRKTWLV